MAEIAVRGMLHEPGPTGTADYRALPRVRFTDPEVGTVGLTEQEARESLPAVRVGTADIPSRTRGWIHGVGNAGIIKLVADAQVGVLVGASVMSLAGGEVLGVLTLAVPAEVPRARLQSMM